MYIDRPSLVAVGRVRDTFGCADSLLRALNPDVSFTDAKLFLYLIEGAVIQRLSSDEVDERVIEAFLRGMG